MEYIEMAAAPKGMFDKMISNDSLRVPFSTIGPGPAGFRPMAIPVFSHGKSLSSSAMAPAPPSGSGTELSRRGSLPSFATSGMSLNGSHMALVNSGNGGLGMMHLQMPVESGSSQQGDDMMEKGMRSRGEGGRGTRGGGTSSRKRTRAVQADSLPTSEAIPDGSLSGGAAASGGRPAAGNGTRHLLNSTGEKAEKSVGRRQSGQGTKRGDKKQSQMVASSVNDTLPSKAGEAHAVPNGWSHGILDIYGLRTRPMDVSRLMVDISLNNLLSGNFEVPSFSLKDNHDTKMEIEEGFEQQIDGVLRLLPKRPVMAETHSKMGENAGNLSAKCSKIPNMVLDLERPLQSEDEDGISRMATTQREIPLDSAPATKLEAGDARDPGADSTAGLVDDSPSTQGPPKFSMDGLSVHSVESFLKKLNLMPSDPLHSLIAQAADGEVSGSADNRVGGDVVELCRKNGSIPPLLFSYPHVGPVKPENSRYNHRVWIRSPTVETSGGKGASGNEGLNGAEEDLSTSPSSRRRKVDIKDKTQSPDGMLLSTTGAPSLSSGQVDPSRTSSIVDPTTSVKEEPRQVENAVGFSSEGNVKPMEVDSGRVESGSVPASGVDGTESAQENTECDRQRGGGDAVRPLETPATLEGPQDMDASSDRQGKPTASTLTDVKQEKFEQQTGKGPQQDGIGEGSLVPSTSNQEPSSALPALDLKINVRSSSPPQNDSSSSLPVCPSSPGAQAAARLLCNMANSTHHPDQDKTDGEKERRRRVFQPYPGAPVQKMTKSIRVSNSPVIPGEGGREGRRNVDGGSVPPSKALFSERRKSLSQVNDASDKPAYSSPRNSSGGGISTASRGGSHTGSRSNSLSVKLEKAASREPTKESASIKELVGRGSSSLPPLSNGGPPLKNGHKGMKTNSYLHSSNSKGGVAAASFPKVPAACTAPRAVSGGTSSRSSRTVHNGNSLASHGPAPVPFKSSRQSIPDSRQKTKSELSGRGGKPNRD